MHATDTAHERNPAAASAVPPEQAGPTPRDPSWEGARGAFDPHRKSPVLACFLSIMPGLGQVYVGYYRRGFVHIAVFAAAMALLINTDPGRNPLAPLIVIFLPFFVLYNIIDAGRRAALYNQAMRGRDLPALPVELPMSGAGGSLAGGLVLILGGFALLLHTYWGVSLAWIQDWWPVAPMLFGVYLVAQSVRERRERAAGERLRDRSPSSEIPDR